ncbi:MAG: tetratricopeptide repeat protein, partial [bacterium]
TVHSVATDEEALEVLRESPVDFILCEWSLPENGGMDLLRAVRANPATPNIPFVMISGRGQLDDDEFAESADYDVDGHLIKPLHQQELEEKVNSVLDQRAETLEVDIKLARAHGFADIEAFDDAIGELEAAQELGSNSPRVWTESGQVYEKVGDPEKAKSCYQEATKADETYTRAYDSLGNLLQKEGKTDEAFELIEKATRISPRNRDRQFKFAEALLNRGDAESARIALHNAVAGDPDIGSRSAAVAEFFLANGRADMAEAEFAFALEADPENVHYYNRLGMAFRRQKKFKEAIDNYRKALVVATNDPVVYYNMALAMTENKEISQAIGALRRALVIQPDFKQAEKFLMKLQSVLDGPRSRA